MGKTPNIKSGFSLLELLLATVLFTAGVLGVFPVLRACQVSQNSLLLRYRALTLAEKKMNEWVRGEWSGGGQEEVFQEGPVSYQVRVQVQEGPGGTRSVRLGVSYPSGKTHETVKLSTLTYQPSRSKE